MSTQTPAKIRAIITGATGMVGEGVLLECLDNPLVESILIINRRDSGFSHPKLTEIVHKDFYDFSSIEDRLHGYNACFFCLGVSVIGMTEQDYYKMTHELTLHVAQTLSRVDQQMTFCYVSGAGTDSTEKGRVMWARIKGKTENDLLKVPFKGVCAFRPGLMKATKGQKNTLTAYKYLGWLFPLFKLISPKKVCTLKEVGQAMINISLYGYGKPIIEVADILLLAHRQK
jgi:hypothetical protein